MPVQSVERATSILRAFSVEEPVLGVTELSKRVGLDKSTVHRLLASLVRGGLVMRDTGSRKYRLGTRLLELGHTFLHSQPPLEIIHPYLHYLAQALGEAAFVSAREGDEVVNLLQVRSPELGESVPWVGRAPLPCTSTGKIFLAHMSEAELKPFLEKDLPSCTAKTITDPADLRQELQRVREQGFATALEEHQEGINAIAVPMKKPDNGVIAALGVAGPSYRFTGEKATGSLEILRGVVIDISRRFRSLPPEVLLLLG